MVFTSATVQDGIVSSISLRHFLVRCGGQSTSTFWKPAAYAAAVAM